MGRYGGDDHPSPVAPAVGRASWVLAELALPAPTVVSGLQLLRLMVSTVVAVYHDRLGAPLASLGVFAFLVVGLGCLAAPAARLLGRDRPWWSPRPGSPWS